MAYPYVASGLNILRGEQQFATAHSAEAAEAVAIMLNKGRLYTSDIGQAELDRVREELWK